MRTLTAAERAIISDPKGHDCFAFLHVTADDGATWKNLGALAVGSNTRDFFNTATLSDSIDSNTISFSATLKREIDVDSLSPFRTDSAVNDSVVSPGTYAPAIDLQRQWKIVGALVPKGTIPDLSDYREWNSGYIRSFVVNGLEDTIELQGMGMEAPILDAFVVQDPNLPGRNAEGDREYSGDQEDVIQQALDDQLGEDVVELYVPGGPTGEAVQDAIGDINLQPALSDIAALTGAVLRYRYDSGDVNRYTLFNPPRSTTTPDFTIAATEYEDLSASVDVTGVRNLIPVTYPDASTNTKQTVVAPGAEAGTVSCVSQLATFSTSQSGVIEDGALIVVDMVGYRVQDFDGTTTCTLVGAPDFSGKQFYTSASLTKYGLQIFPMDFSVKAQITDATAAGNLADAVLSDRQDPSLVQRFKAPGLWFVQLCDYVTVTANNVHADEDHSGGVTSYTMTFADAMLDVEVFLADRVKGRFTTWKRVGSGSGASQVLPQMLSLSVTFEDDGTFGSLDAVFVFGPRAQSARLELSDDPTFATVWQTNDFDPLVSGTESEGVYGFPDATYRNKKWYARVTPYSGPFVSLTGVTGIPGPALTANTWAGFQVPTKPQYDTTVADIRDEPYTVYDDPANLTNARKWVDSADATIDLSTPGEIAILVPGASAPAAGAGQGVYELSFFDYGSAQEPLKDIPSSFTEISDRLRRAFYGVGMSKFQLVANVVELAGGSEAIRIGHASAGGTSFTDPGSGADLPLNRLGVVRSDWLTMPGGMAADCDVSPHVLGGDGTRRARLTSLKLRASPTAYTGGITPPIGGGGGAGDFHYDAQNMGSYADEDAVTTWVDCDQPGASHDAPAGNSSFSGHYDTGVINGYPGVRIESLGGNSRGYIIPGGFAPTEGEVWAVIRARAGGRLWHFGSISFGPNVPTAVAGSMDDHFGSSVLRTFNLPAGVDPTQPFIYRARAKAGEWTAWVNGTQVYTNATNTATWGVSEFGHWLSGGAISNSFDGWFGEMHFLGSGFLSTSAAAAKLALWLSKWGIP